MSAKGWIILLSVLAVLMIIEKIIAIRRNVNTYSFADFMANLTCGILERVFAFFWLYVFYVASMWVFENVTLWEIPKNPATWILALFATDFLAYWHHRLSHEINFLWAAHIVHHQSEDLNVSTVFRVSFFAVINRSFFFIWLPVMGFHPDFAATAILFVGAFQFVTHSRLVGKLGFLEKIFSTPSNHRVHHARNEKYIDHNYGHVFMMWDKMFGTYTPEEEEPDYGITTGFDSENAYNSNLFYWKDLFKRAGMASSVKDKIKIFFTKPDWTPADVGYLPSQFKTDEKGNRLPHSRPMSKQFGFYLLINTLLTLVLFVSMFAIVEDPKRTLFRDLIDNKHLLVLVLTILFSVFVHGRLLDNKRASKILDTARLVILAVAIPFIYSGTNVTAWIGPVIWAYSAVMIVWLWMSDKTHLSQPLGKLKAQGV
ncbi:MAG: alkylglycerol monooxygenase [Bacteroidia bacterium]|jgi:alkylglycerol monooxygenase